MVGKKCKNCVAIKIKWVIIKVMNPVQKDEVFLLVVKKNILYFSTEG